MSISLGLMLRIDTFPLAVAVPPLPQGIQSAPALIEADKVVEPASVTLTKPFHRGGGDSQNSTSARPQLLTYSRQGSGGASTQSVNGRLLNIYV